MLFFVTGIMNKRKFETKKRDLSSFDYLLMLGFSILGFFSIVISVILSLKGIVSVFIILFSAIIVINLGIKHRIKHQWRWQRVRGKELYKAIAFTTLYLVMIPRWIVHSFHGTSRVNGRGQFNWQPEHPFNLLEYINEAIEVLPKLISSSEHNIQLGFLCLMIMMAIFYLLLFWKVTYLSEKEFLEYCKNPNPIKFAEPKSYKSNLSKSNSPIARITSFFSDRPFIRRKQHNAIEIEFHRVTAYDLKANFAVVIFLLLFCIAALWGAVTMVVFAIPDVIKDPEVSEHLSILIPTLALPAIFMMAIAFFIWNNYLKQIFIRLILKFERDKFIVTEQAFGSKSEIINISKLDLPSLQEKQENTQVPQVKNTSLRIRHRGKNIEIAGHLLPEAMNIVQATYDRYRNSEFNNFYLQTENIFLE